MATGGSSAEGADASVPIQLQAGPLEMVFEPGEAFLRYVRFGSREVLRGVYAAVRDQNWGTVKPDVRNLRVEKGLDSFQVSFDVECKEGDIDFAWSGRLIGTADGTVIYEFDGLARSTFLRNRIGFCVLHPIEPCAGKPCTVRKADGTTISGRFPQWISPHQPFKEMRGITHTVLPGIEAEVAFEGDLFEMEDQRNWTDASYKTYCTPLELPFPVEVAQGQRIRQSVTLTIKPAGAKLPAAAAKASSTSQVELTVDRKSLHPLAKIGLGLASHGRPLSDRQIARLQALRLDHLRVDLRAGESGWRGRLAQAAIQAQRLAASLEIAIFLTDDADAELTAVAAECKRLGPAVSDWLIFHVAEKSTSRRWVQLAGEVLPMGGCPGRIACGTNAYFAELNRNRPPADACDAVCYSINPQVHAFDNASLIETLVAQGYTVASAMEFTGGGAILATPVTLRPRFNPNATGSQPPIPPGQLPSQVDARQTTLFGAAWTMGSIKYLSAAGAAGATYYETTGWRGVMELDDGCTLAELFPSVPGGVFPLYHVLADVGEFAGCQAAATHSSDPLRVDGLTLLKDRRCRLLLANFSAIPQKVVVSLAGLTQATLFVMDRSNVSAAMSRPEEFRAAPGRKVTATAGQVELELAAEGIARLDAEMENPST